MGRFVVLAVLTVGCSSGAVPVMSSGDMESPDCVYELTEPASSGVCEVSANPFSVRIELASGPVDVMADNHGGHLEYAGCNQFNGAIVFNDMPSPAWDFDLNSTCIADAAIRITGRAHGVIR